MANQSKSPIKREHKSDLLYFIAVLLNPAARHEGRGRQLQIRQTLNSQRARD
jgi:hypothetical protein